MFPRLSAFLFLGENWHKGQKAPIPAALRDFAKLDKKIKLFVPLL